MTSEHRARASRYLILVEGGPPSNYSAWCPDLPGCVATGATLERCVSAMREAIAFHVEGLQADGQPVPPPRREAGGAYVKVAA